MATNFPTGLDSLTNPISTDTLAAVSHSAQHANANDAIEALQAKVGVDASAVATSLDKRVAVIELRLLLEVVSSARTYYVAASGGSDSNNGLTGGAPFATIQKAVDVIVAGLWILPGVTVTVQLADGTYTEAVTLKIWQGPGQCTIAGNGTTPANVIWQTTAANANTVTSAATTQWIVRDCQLQASGTAGNAVYAVSLGRIALDNVRFGATTNAHIKTAYYGYVTMIGNYTIAGAATVHWQAVDDAIISCTGVTITITGTPAFSGRFAQAVRTAIIACQLNTFSGSATGQRYASDKLAIIETGTSGNATYLPGNSAGSLTNGGLYF